MLVEKKEKEKKGEKKTRNITARSRNINGILVTGFLKAEEICSLLLFEFERSGRTQQKGKLTYSYIILLRVSVIAVHRTYHTYYGSL